jgi:RNA polymerase sigma-70 factor (ECF subfamily)
MDDRTDEQLIQAARENDEKAFMEIIERYEPRIAATIVGMLGNCAEAEDVGQETFIRFYQALDSFRGESSLNTYLTRIAINLSLNELKRRKRGYSLFSKKASDEFHDIPSKVTMKLPYEDRELVDKALKRLKPEYRSVLVLRLVNGYSTTETASILNLPQGTVLSRLARGQSKMRELLKPYYGGSQ